MVEMNSLSMTYLRGNCSHTFSSYLQRKYEFGEIVLIIVLLLENFGLVCVDIRIYQE